MFCRLAVTASFDQWFAGPGDPLDASAVAAAVLEDARARARTVASRQYAAQAGVTLLAGALAAALAGRLDAHGGCLPLLLQARARALLADALLVEVLAQRLAVL